MPALFCFLTIIFCVPLMLFSQSLSPVILSFGGGYATNDQGSLSWNIGEIAIRNVYYNNAWLTEGFEQLTPLRSNEGDIDADIFIPKGITPDNDGANDSWVIDSLLEKFPLNEIIIFNRWGEPVYEAKPYRNDWKGHNRNGQKLPPGAYYYWLKLGPGYRAKKGPIYIIS